MFTPKHGRPLVLAALAAVLLPGCTPSLPPEEYGEVITEIPPELNRPFPMPELSEQQPDEAKPAAE